MKPRDRDGSTLQARRLLRPGGRRMCEITVLALTLCLGPTLRGAPAPNTARSVAGLERWELTVDGVNREALVRVPDAARTNPAPVVFVFHGHGGNSRSAARKFALHEHWPEAIVVYPQGLNTPGRLTDPEGRRPGWQHRAGDHGDRDLKLFDALLARLRRDARVDNCRIFATGHSNGGGFTYLLWVERGDLLAAVAPSAAAGARFVASTPKPKPVMHLAGERDPLVKFTWQQATMNALRRINHCKPEGRPWAEHCTIYDSPNGTPVVTYIHPGGHEFPSHAVPLIVRFFKEHPAATQ
ncbi:MAG: esterase [Verrucomicrobiae bacterium]|nr:esterase [Verrucomicrobiae bacterium]